MNNNIFENIIKLNKENLIEHIVTPVTPYFICNHFISTEIHPKSPKFINYNVDNIKANNLLKNKNYNDIQNFDIIQIQVDYFDFFYDEILPIIINKDIKVIIITSQWHLPQIQQNYKTDCCLNNKNILLWISQNPIYTNHKKYMAIPYGLLHHYLKYYIGFVKSYDNNIGKSIKILNQSSSIHNHLPENHIRKLYDIFGKNSGPHLNYKDYLKNISNAEFVISTSGDRDDCYRHYECIGLNAIPVSNIKDGYKDIFEENMIYSNPQEMINMINNKIVNYNYYNPNKDILTVQYWIEKINKKINELKI
jgi:hypothetical protein